MRLENLRQNFAKMSFDEQLSFMEDYRRKREVDLTTVVPLPDKQAKKKLASGNSTNGTRTRGKKEKLIPVTAEALEMLKKLGLV